MFLRAKKQGLHHEYPNNADRRQNYTVKIGLRVGLNVQIASNDLKGFRAGIARKPRRGATKKQSPG